MNISELIKYLENLQKDMPDIIIRKIKVGLFKYVYVIVDQTVSSSDRVNDFVLKFFSNKSIFGSSFKNFKNAIISNIPAINYKNVRSKDELVEFLFSGFTIVIYDGEVSAYETRGELDRGINEPSSEPVVRGPKDSFTENYEKNIGLIRKRLKSEYLVLKEVTVGKESKSKVGIMYMSNICEDELKNEVIKTLENINIDGVTDVNNFKSYIDNNNRFTFFPTCLYTEKPDDVCRYLLEGRVIVTMDNSPSILIAPTFFIDFFHNSEDYYHKPFFSSFMRIVRFVSFFIAIVTPALFIAIVTYDQEIIPVSLLINFAEQRNNVPFPVIIEAFLLMFTFELLYEGDARTPVNRGTSLSILGALILGDAAVQAGLISPIMVIVVSVSAISSLIFTYYDIQGSIRFWRYLLMISSALFGIVGFVVGFLILIINLCSVKTFGKPYTLPMLPFLKNEQADAVIRREIKHIKKRPTYITKKNVIREDSK